MNMILQYILRKPSQIGCFIKLGMVNKKEKYAFLLGYNYQSSQWYEVYRILNKDYEKKRKVSKDEKNKILKKFKNLFK